MRNSAKSGQILLTVVLIMIIALTVSLSVATRSIINTKLAIQSGDSQKAFQAAEAGIEEILGSTTNVNITSQQFSPGVMIDSVTSSQISGKGAGGNMFYFIQNNGLAVNQDDSTDIWLSDYSTNLSLRYLNPWSGNLNIYWGKSNNGCNDAALEIMLIYGTKTAPLFSKYAVDPCVARANNNKFSLASSVPNNINGQNFYYESNINISSGLILVITPLYSSTPIAIGADNSVPFPSQGRIITSSATAGSVSKKIIFFQGYDSIPSEFFNNLFSIQ